MSILTIIIILIFNSCTNSVSSDDYEDTLCLSGHYHSYIDGRYVHQYYASWYPGDVYYCSSCGSGYYIYPYKVQLSGESSEKYHWAIGSVAWSSNGSSICQESTWNGPRSLMWTDLTDHCEYEWRSYTGSYWIDDTIYIDPCPDSTTTTTSSPQKDSIGLIIGIIVAVIIVLALIVVIIVKCKKKQKPEPVKEASAHGEKAQMIYSQHKPTPYIQQVKQVPIVAAPHTEQIQMIGSEYKPTPIYQQQVKQIPVQNKPRPPPVYNYEAVPATVPSPAYAEGAKNVPIECDRNYEIKQWFYSQVNLPEDNDRYFDMFIQNGFDDLDIIKQMSGPDLVEMGITKLGHQRKILNAISKL